MKKLIVSETIRCSHDIFRKFLYDYVPSERNHRNRRRNSFRNTSQDCGTETYPEIGPLGSSAHEISNDLSAIRNLDINAVAAIDNLVVVSYLPNSPGLPVENFNSGAVEHPLYDNSSHIGEFSSPSELHSPERLQPLENLF